jgi:hypothetical protein
MLIVAVMPAEASVIGVGVGAFGAGSTLSTFAGLPDFTEVNGLTVDGILYNYSLGNGQVVINGGPGTTNNITPPNVVTVPGGNPAGILTLTFPSARSQFGFGYAVLTTTPVTNATTITLFDGATNVGSLSYNAVPDPTFSGGFAGIASTLPFNSARVTFNSVDASAFAMDNVRTTPVTSAPEPSTVALLGTGLVLLQFCRRSARVRFQ